jgi:hypothetical protein
MMLEFCSQEKELAAALQEERWPDAVDPALRAHVDACRSCGELVLVAQTLRQSRNEAAQQAVLPAPGALWWRAQMRRRRGAVERMTRPIAVVEKLAFASVVLCLLCLAAWQWSPISEWVLRSTSAARPATSILDNLWTPFASAGGWIPALLIAGLGTLAVFGGLAVYLLVEKE